VRDVDPALPAYGVTTMTDALHGSFAEARFNTLLLTLLGAIGLVLAAIGIYGVVAYFVSLRTHEIGVRVALGARAADVMRLVIGRGVALTGVGVLIGVLGAAAITRVAATLLFNVSPTDPVSFVGVSTFLIGVSALASYVPARRATRVDPLEALRHE
jgi:putative ABC transport system permease protein